MTARPEPLLFLVGPTAVGKSELALELAERLGAWIVSLDSMQVYRGMDVGTAKPGPAERARVPHRCLDLVSPSERYDAQRYLVDARAALAQAAAAGRRGLFVGGTGFYLKALTRGLFGGPPADLELRARLRERASQEGGAALHAELGHRDPASAARIHPNDERRVLRALEVLEQTGRPLSDWQREWGWHARDPGGLPYRVLGLSLPSELLAQRIRRRIEAMLEGGWVEEVRRIRAGEGFGPTAIQALGYSEVLALADGARTRAETEERIVQLTNRFVRRQGTWFRSLLRAQQDPGVASGWFDARELREPGGLDRARDFLLGVAAAG